jgi:4-hydroxybenzoate polyprenyltransferase
VAVFYATAVLRHTSILSLWLAALTLFLSIVPGAAYVSVINDLTDRVDDRLAGKPNRAEGQSRRTIALVLVASIGAGVIFAWTWRHDNFLLTCYLGAWLAFSLYSLPPFRLKVRGLLGVLCDASGAHLFPTLVGALLAFDGRAPDRVWLACVAIWALAYGLRGILWHQLTDIDNDRAANVRTFVQRYPSAAVRLGTFVIFPAEVIALGFMLWRLHQPLPAAFLVLYVLFAGYRIRRWKTNAVIVAPKPRFFIVLHEYYDVLFPIALLVTACVHHLQDAVVLPIHILLFPKRLLRMWRDVRRIPLQLMRHLGAHQR